MHAQFDWGICCAHEQAHACKLWHATGIACALLMTFDGLAFSVHEQLLRKGWGTCLFTQLAKVGQNQCKFERATSLGRASAALVHKGECKLIGAAA